MASAERRASAACALLGLLACATSAAADPALEVRVESQQLRFETRGARPVYWRACRPDCEAALSSAVFNAPGDPPQLALIAAEGAAPGPPIDEREYRFERRDEPDAIVLDFRSAPLPDGLVIHKRYRIARRGYTVTLRLELGADGGSLAPPRDPPLEVRLVTGAGFPPPPLPGFGASSARVRAVCIGPGGARDPCSFEGDAPVPALEPGSWAGLRTRFWLLLARAENPAARIARRPGGLGIAVPGDGLELVLYAGPLEHARLREVDPGLTAILLSGLWFWVRWIALGMLFLLDGLQRLFGSPGLAIVLLACSVKLLTRPLTALAERWQRDVNAKRSRLAPQLDQIKQSYRGAEQSRRLLAAHHELGISPFFGLKSLLGVLIQIPIFFAAYHMLEENVALSGVPLLWIEDLARPDCVAALPFRLPFLGDCLSLLPFLMTGFTLLASRLHDDGSLSAELLRRQRLGLYAMAFGFFVLFYTFPAGMVLYWTTNNAIALAKDQVTRWRGRRGRGDEVDERSSR